MIALDVETTLFDPETQKTFQDIKVISLASKNKIKVIPVESKEDILKVIEPLKGKDVVIHNAKYEYKCFLKYGIYLDEYFTIHDTMIAAKVQAREVSAARQKASLAAVTSHYLKVILEKDEVQTSDWTMRPLSDKQVKYCENDVRYLIPLYERITSQLKGKDILKLEESIIPMISTIEERGMPFNRRALDHEPFDANKMASIITNVYHSGDERIHPHFDQIGTATGRIISRNPSLQNVDKTFLKKYFYSYTGIDFDQQEIRVLYDIIEKPLSFDIHAKTAKEVLGDESLRDKAKTINFAIIYGIGYKGLANQLDINIFESQKIMDKFHRTYPEISRYIRNASIKKVAKSKYGRYMLVDSAAKAINYPIQATAADMLKLVLRDLWDKYRDKIPIINLKYDEIVVENDTMVKEVKEVMEKYMPVSLKTCRSGSPQQT